MLPTQGKNHSHPLHEHPSPFQIDETNNSDADDRRQSDSNTFLTCGTLTSNKSFQPTTSVVDIDFKVDEITQKKGFLIKINYPNA